jgi:microcompartment protein CcmL/EutN
MSKDSIGLIELTSIASGYQTADAMLKAAAVDLLLSRSICSGKYMVMVRGDVSSVQAAVSNGVSAARFSVIDSFVIANLHEAVFPAIAGSTKVETLEALGILE